MSSFKNTVSKFPEISFIQYFPLFSCKRYDVITDLICSGSRVGAVVRALASHQCVPGSIPGPGVICGVSLLLVLYSAPRGFSPGTPVFPSHQKPTLLNSNSIWKQWMKSHFVEMPLQIQISTIFFSFHRQFKTRIFALQASLLGQISLFLFIYFFFFCFKNIKFPRGNYQPL